MLDVHDVKIKVKNENNDDDDRNKHFELHEYFNNNLVYKLLKDIAKYLEDHDGCDDIGVDKGSNEESDEDQEKYFGGYNTDILARITTSPMPTITRTSTSIIK
ncbi:hypothetical protein Glove_57g71 [Diversispora epigaea]|uniref:Uncharacterized protein n=1 Tax=Diversispora epigaea TaxID=1348612 RepID=A0A397JEJ2_9GLOM|nr:hypothetical protein Glove_57g71 [Diversispora epigaea]